MNSKNFLDIFFCLQLLNSDSCICIGKPVIVNHSRVYQGIRHTILIIFWKTTIIVVEQLLTDSIRIKSYRGPFGPKIDLEMAIVLGYRYHGWITIMSTPQDIELIDNIITKV